MARASESGSFKERPNCWENMELKRGFWKVMSARLLITPIFGGILPEF